MFVNFIGELRLKIGCNSGCGGVSVCLDLRLDLVRISILKMVENNVLFVRRSWIEVCDGLFLS